MQIVRMPDGRLAHFVDGVSPEELRRYIIPDVPDAVADPGMLPSGEPVPPDLVMPDLSSARRLPGEIHLWGTEQVPFDLVVPDLPSSRRLPGEINHPGPGMPMQMPAEPEWDFHPFPVGDAGGAFQRYILNELAKQEFNRARPTDSAEAATPPPGVEEPGGGFPFADLLEPVGRGVEDARNTVFGRWVGDKYQMPNWTGVPFVGPVFRPIGYDGRLNTNPSYLPPLDPFSVYANETFGTLPGIGPATRDWFEEGDASFASWMEGKPVTAEEREAINAANAEDFPESALAGKVTGEVLIPLLLERLLRK